jgi:hypothetical protein
MFGVPKYTINRRERVGRRPRLPRAGIGLARPAVARESAGRARVSCHPDAWQALTGRPKVGLHGPGWFVSFPFLASFQRPSDRFGSNSTP